MKWLGHPQHFIGADECHFLLATLLDNGFLISTIGEYVPHGKEYLKENFVEIGSGRLYETYVFKTKGEFRECGCPLILDHLEIDSKGYNHPKDAQNGHIEMIEKWKLIKREEYETT